MDRRKQEIYNWLAAQVDSKLANGATVESGSMFRAIQNAFPDNPLTKDEICEELVRLCGGLGLAVEFNDQRTV